MRNVQILGGVVMIDYLHRPHQGNLLFLINIMEKLMKLFYY